MASSSAFLKNSLDEILEQNIPERMME